MAFHCEIAYIIVSETTIFEEVVHELLGEVFHRGLPQPSEDLLIAKCMREYDRHARELLRFKIDEMRIVNFNNEESDSILYRLNSQYLR